MLRTPTTRAAPTQTSKNSPLTTLVKARRERPSLRKTPVPEEKLTKIQTFLGQHAGLVRCELVDTPEKELAGPHALVAAASDDEEAIWFLTTAELYVLSLGLQTRWADDMLSELAGRLAFRPGHCVLFGEPTHRTFRYVPRTAPCVTEG